MTKTATLTTRTIQCPTCQIEIGRLAIVDGRVYLLHGAILARQLIHNCAVDGRAFYWHGKEEDGKVMPDLVGVVNGN